MKKTIYDMTCNRGGFHPECKTCDIYRLGVMNKDLWEIMSKRTDDPNSFGISCFQQKFDGRKVVITHHGKYAVGNESGVCQSIW
jgi:hypothetical protein